MKQSRNGLHDKLTAQNTKLFLHIMNTMRRNSARELFDLVAITKTDTKRYEVEYLPGEGVVGV